MSLADLLNQAYGPMPWLIANSEVLGITTADYSHDIAYDLGPEDSSEAQATARLIALAPDMARLLIDMAAELRVIRNRPIFEDDCDKLLARFAALNAKAGGTT